MRQTSHAQRRRHWWRQASLLVLSCLTIGGCASIAARGPRASDTVILAQSRQAVRVVHYDASRESFPNPERGFYGWANSMWIGPELHPVAATDLKKLRTRGITLVRMYYVMDEFRDGPLSQAALERMQLDFDAVREAGLKVIPRFAYNFPRGELDRIGFTGMEDAPVDRVLSHIDQLEPILRAHSDVIAFLEAGFVGAWGEWHHSSNVLVNDDGTINEHSIAIMDRVLSLLPLTRSIALRYPYIKQQFFGEEPLTREAALTGAPAARVGAHNDCFLRDDVDSGTYSRSGEHRPPAAFIEAQKQYLHLDNRFVPQGGETCAADAQARPYIACRVALRELARLRWSTLNISYHPDVIRVWQRQGCFEEVRWRLGYRLRLLMAELPSVAIAGESLHLSFTVRNDGWAAPFNPRRVEVILRHVDTRRTHTIDVNADPRFWGAGETHRVDVHAQLPETLQEGTYQILLNLPDPEPRLYGRPEYSIRLANAGLWEADSGFNDLRARVVVTRPE